MSGEELGSDTVLLSEVRKSKGGGKMNLMQVESFPAAVSTEAMNYLQERQALGEIVTGLIYVDSSAEDLHRYLNTVEKPLNKLEDAELCPGSNALQALNASLRCNP